MLQPDAAVEYRHFKTSAGLLNVSEQFELMKKWKTRLG